MLLSEPYRKFRMVMVFGVMVFGRCCMGDEIKLQDQAAAALRKASAYMYSISTNGGYVGIYSNDLTKRYGEAFYEKARPTQIWVQPPGTPSVGESFLRAYRVTGEKQYLLAATETARALAWGQRAGGGWDHLVDVEHLRKGAEKVIRKDGRCTFDDNITQGALDFLMDMDEVLDEPWLTEAIELGLAFMMESQFANGAWPQWYPLRGGYHDYYTFNDNVFSDCIKVMLRAHKTYGRQEYLDSARRAGDFIILSQIPSPQAGWAQQYSHDMKPAWARRFEPLGVCSLVTGSNIRMLVDLYLYTKDKKYLEPIPKAIAWLEDSKIGDSLWARLYEVGSNRPIYGDREDGNKIHYDYEKISDKEKRSYGWQGGMGIEYAIVYYRRAAQPAAMDASAKKGTQTAMGRISKELETKVRDTIEALDEQGRWMQDGMLYSRVFVRNVSLLCNYLRLKNF